MRATFDREFLKKYKKSNVRIRNQFDKRFRVFVKDPIDPQLRNHPLRNKWLGYRSINITADWRAIYREIQIGEETIAYFVALGTHKELYK